MFGIMTLTPSLPVAYTPAQRKRWGSVQATAPPAKPPPPLSFANQRPVSPPPSPQHAAIPFTFNDNPPVQETNPSPEAVVHDAEGAQAPPLLPVQNGSQSPPSEGQEDNPSDSEEKCHPAPVQMPEQEDEAAIQTDQAGEDQLS